jgi:hypothetical protein
MNIVEMHTLCDLLLDKANSPWFSSEEKDSFLNLAHEEFVQNNYELFELDERIRKYLLPLVRRQIGTNTSTINLDSIKDYMYTLNLMGQFKKVCGTGTELQKVSPLQLDDEGENEKDPFNKSADDNPLYTEENTGANNVILIMSDNTPASFILKYLKVPRQVFNDEDNPANNIDSEMPIFTHEDIVNIAVRKMMATTEQQINYQLQSNEISKTK